MKRLILLNAFLILILAPLKSFSAVIEGVVLFENGPVEDSCVSAYSSFRDIEKGTPSFVSATGEKKGFYKLDLPPGTYFLIASGQSYGKKYFSYHGANPIKIEYKNLWIPFMAVSETAVSLKESSSTKLSGKVLFKNNPVKNAHVSIYPLAAGSFRGMGFLTSTTDDNGIFSMGIEPGEYVVIARKRTGNSGMTPLEKGDLFCYPAANPVNIAELKEIQVEIPCYPKDDLKAFLNEDAYPALLVKKSDVNSMRFRENTINEARDLFRIKGRATDLMGNPVKDLYVMAYKGKPSDMFQMHYVRTMPDYMVRADEKGNYSIDAAAGAYYLVARQLVGEAPVKGEYYGLYEANANHLFIINDKSHDAVNIFVNRVMAEEQQRDKSIDPESVIRNYEYKGDIVIDKNTEWSGKITINGIIHVARGAILTIDPGTTVRFKKVDRTRDGVGDAMIKVSGRLEALGSAIRPIRFTSAETTPDKADWSYLLFFVSGDESIISHCIFEYAFSGVQAHFSKVVIKDSVFRDNYEGIRFGRADLRIDHNDIFDNTYGVRHTRVEEPVEITHNNIRNNGVGIFLVPSNQNIVDFSDTFDKKDAIARKQFIVTYNNIAYNTEYNYRMGERQGYDIMIKENWWGMEQEKQIIDTIFDENEDSSLGSVIYKPYLVSPAKDAGAIRGGVL
ncbi:MAG: right-handed parallel beta-helix repeat-containing protein [Nitrospirae bacterium]|nr:right-handed parallel beta-helix repeat-containing protein [Nitrospirota bacterium]